jgi:hypothetical protein
MGLRLEEGRTRGQVSGCGRQGFRAWPESLNFEFGFSGRCKSYGAVKWILLFFSAHRLMPGYLALAQLPLLYSGEIMLSHFSLSKILIQISWRPISRNVNTLNFILTHLISRGRTVAGHTPHTP